MAEQNALEFHGTVAYSDEYDAGVPVGLDQGEAMAESLGDASVLMLRNHGVIVVGPTVGIAYTNLYLLERCCRVQWLAQNTGKPLAIIPDDRRGGAGDGVKEQHFAAMRRVLDRHEPRRMSGSETASGDSVGEADLRLRAALSAGLARYLRLPWL